MRFKMFNVVATTFISSVLLTSCATSDLQNVISDGSAVSISDLRLQPTDPNKVKLYFGDHGLPKHYKVIGHVSADQYNIAAVPRSQKSIAAELKKQAASIGATGVINIDSGMDKTTGDAIK